MPLPVFQTREEYARTAEAYRPKSMPTIQWLGELEKGWIAACRRAGKEPYGPPKGDLTATELAEAALVRERAREQVAGFLAAVPTCALSREELVAGVLAEQGRDPFGRKR